MRIAVLLLMSLIVISRQTPAFAATINLPAAVDGTVQFSGAFGLEAFGTEPLVRTNSSGPNNNRSGVFEFDLSDLPSDARIMSATLRLTTAELIANPASREAPLTFQAYSGNGLIQIDDFGTEDEREDAAMVVAIESLPAAPLSPPPGTVLNVSLSNLEPLQSAVGNSSFFGVRTITEDFVSFQVHSRENGNRARTPTLEVEFVPEPRTGLMLALGFLSLVGLCRRD